MIWLPALPCLPIISASIIFIARVEMRFHEKYKLYSEAVIGGKETISKMRKSVCSASFPVS
ncbi:MAG: exopolysaccharide Pel transporter PelG [Fusicatenibacter saccharivorans]